MVSRDTDTIHRKPRRLKNAANQNTLENRDPEKWKVPMRIAIPAAINWSPAVEKVTSIRGDQKMPGTKARGGERTSAILERGRNPSAQQKRRGEYGVLNMEVDYRPDLGSGS